MSKSDGRAHQTLRWDEINIYTLQTKKKRTIDGDGADDHDLIHISRNYDYSNEFKLTRVYALTLMMTVVVVLFFDFLWSWQIDIFCIEIWPNYINCCV